MYFGLIVPAYSKSKAAMTSSTANNTYALSQVTPTSLLLSSSPTATIV
jgi:hypothetical protein